MTKKNKKKQNSGPTQKPQGSKQRKDKSRTKFKGQKEEESSDFEEVNTSNFGLVSVVCCEFGFFAQKNAIILSDTI